jgi:Tol biopolymer transport system component
VDHRADVYAVGVLAYELLTGRTPFADAEPRSRLPAHVTAALRALTTLSPDVPEALATTIARCLAVRPDDRWQSAEELLAHLASSASGAVPAPARSSPRRAARAATVAAVVGAASVAIFGVALVRGRAVPPALAIGLSTRLTSEPGLEVQPSISPDGRHVAYAVGHALRMRVAVRPVAGGRARWLTTDGTANEWLPRWSPDGERILFLSRGGVASAPAIGGPARQEVAGRPGAIVRSATWSADGREIAYVRGDSLLARAVASGETRLITTGADLHSCSWSPEGARIACVSGNSFYVTPGAASGTGPMFGNLAPSRIVLVPAAGGRPVSVTDGGSLHQSPAWSRDGRTLYYVSSRQGPRDVYALDLRAPTAPSRVPVRVTTGMNAHSITFSADGARMAYARYESSANVWAMPIPATPPASPASPASAVPVTSGNQTVEGVRVSPDGRWLVYDSDLSGNSDVYRVPIAGGEAERLTRGPSDEFRGALSPSGRELAYHSFQTGARNVFLLPLDGGPVRQLTRSPGQRSMPNWSPDGAALALFDMSTDAVLVMRRDRRGHWSAPRFVGGRGWRAEWSPDGRTLAFVSPTDGRIGLVPADSGAPRDLYVPGDGDPLAELAVFAASGRELYFKSHDAQGRASFWSIPVTGGRPRLLVRFDDPARSSNRFDFASDGRRLYFTMEDRQSDVWVAEIARR